MVHGLLILLRLQKRNFSLFYPFHHQLWYVWYDMKHYQSFIHFMQRTSLTGSKTAPDHGTTTTMLNICYSALAAMLSLLYLFPPEGFFFIYIDKYIWKCGFCSSSFFHGWQIFSPWRCRIGLDENSDSDGPASSSLCQACALVVPESFLTIWTTFLWAEGESLDHMHVEFLSNIYDFKPVLISENTKLIKPHIPNSSSFYSLLIMHAVKSFCPHK